MRRVPVRRVLALCLAAACLLTIVGCRTKIGNIVGNPDKYKNKEVIVYGKVTKKLPIPFFETAAYLLEDESGEIWVLTKRSALPEVGQKLKVHAIVEAGMRVGPREFGLVLSELTKELVQGDV